MSATVFLVIENDYPDERYDEAICESRAAAIEFVRDNRKDLRYGKYFIEEWELGKRMRDAILNRTEIPRGKMDGLPITEGLT